MGNVNKKSKVLLMLSITCIIFAVGVWYIEKSLAIYAICLLVVGVVSLFQSIIQLIKLAPKIGQGALRKCIFIGILIMLWFAWLLSINYLGYKYNLRFDLTKLKQHTVTDSTKDLLYGLTSEIQLTSFYVGVPPKYLEDLLKEYSRLSNGKITAEIIDPIVDIGYAARFGNIIDGKQQKLIVQSGSQRQDIDFTESALNEELINNAIIRTLRDKRRVYFLTGHGEYNIFEEKEKGLSLFAKILEVNNIIPKRIMLGVSDGMPDDCDVLVIAGPKDFLTKREEKIISEYLDKGGDALFLIENTVVTTPDKPLTEEEKEKNPSLNEILKNWGIEVQQDIVVDSSSHASGDVGSPATRNYMAHRAIVGSLDYTFYVRPRSIKMVRNRRKTIKIAPLVLTASNEHSWGETNRYLEVEYDEGEDRAGPVPIAFVAWEPVIDTKTGKKIRADKTSDTRLAVFTDADFITNIFIKQYSNAEMGLNIVNWLSELDYKTFVDKKSKEIEVERLDLTSRQKRIVVFILFLIPVVILILGLRR
ncbi:MAG: GldG family protein [Candidatus Zapsychrus exili]|nr:GldG family protein [Candidatus Zapsychrus exili]